MITYVYGDILQSPAKVLVNAVNTVGVMGKGIAYDFKLCFPDMFERYSVLCQDGAFNIGQLMLYKTAHKWVLNFPTKRHWRSTSRLEDIEVGLQNFVATYAERGITSVSFPQLGTGSGRLDWERQVRPLMESYLAPLPITAYIHIYDTNDRFYLDKRSIRSIRSWLEGDPEQVSFNKFWRSLNRLIRTQFKFKTLDSGEKFTLGKDKKRRGHNLVLLTTDPQPLFISESLLVDLWAYIRSAGYALPANFPGGLDIHASVIVTLLSELNMLEAIHLTGDEGVKQIGLHFIPPVQKSGHVHYVEIALINSS